MASVIMSETDFFSVVVAGTDFRLVLVAVFFMVFLLVLGLVGYLAERIIFLASSSCDIAC